MPYQENTLFGKFFRGQIASLTASNEDFVPNLNQNNSLSGNVSIAGLSGEFGAVVNHIFYRLGSPIISVELQPEQIASCFEQAQLKFSSIVNTYFIESWVAQLLGISQSYTNIDFQKKLPMANDTFLKMFADSQIMGSDKIYTGNYTKRKGFIDVSPNSQMYDIYSSGYDQSTSLPLEQYIASVTGYGVHFLAFYHNEGAYINKMYDPYGGQQFINAQFQGASYQSDVVYQVLPLWQELQRGAIMSDYDYMRRSQFRHTIFGRKLEVIPMPQTSYRMFFDYFVEKEPGTQVEPLLEGSYSGLNYLATSAVTNAVVTNFGNIPIKDMKYEEMNSLGRTWVREYTLALAMETLAFERGKMGSIPLPGSDSISLNSGDLLSRSDAMKTELYNFLREELEKMNLYNILEKESAKVDAYYNILQKSSPMPIWTDRSLAHR